jgi:hypothetical protein
MIEKVSETSDFLLRMTLLIAGEEVTAKDWPRGKFNDDCAAVSIILNS